MADFAGDIGPSADVLQTVILVDYSDDSLFPLTKDTPECLLQIANRPVLAYQLDLLEKCGAVDFLTRMAPRKLNIELISYSESEDILLGTKGNANGLRAICERIRGDFVCIAANSFCLLPLGDLTTLHRRRSSDLTVALAMVPFDLPTAKGAPPKMRVSSQDQECIGVCADGRLVLKTAAKAETPLVLSRPLVHRCDGLNIRLDLVDIGVYIISRWVLDLLFDDPTIANVRADLIPFLIQKQFQRKDYIHTTMPSIENRTRTLGSLADWGRRPVGSTGVGIGGAKQELADILAQALSEFNDEPSTFVHSPKKSASSADADECLTEESAEEKSAPCTDDLLFVYALVCENSGSPASPSHLVGKPSAQHDEGYPNLLRRLNRVDTYLELNREVLQRAINARNTNSLFLPLKGFQKKQSTLGEGSVLGAKTSLTLSAVGRNCTIGDGCVITNSIIMDGVKIGNGCKIDGSVLCSGVEVDASCSISGGSVLGSGARVWEGSVLVKKIMSGNDDDDDDEDAGWVQGEAGEASDDDDEDDDDED